MERVCSGCCAVCSSLHLFISPFRWGRLTSIADESAASWKPLYVCSPLECPHQRSHSLSRTAFVQWLEIIKALPRPQVGQLWKNIAVSELLLSSDESFVVTALQPNISIFCYAPCHKSFCSFVTSVNSKSVS